MSKRSRKIRRLARRYKKERERGQRRILALAKGLAIAAHVLAAIAAAIMALRRLASLFRLY